MGSKIRRVSLGEIYIFLVASYLFCSTLTIGTTMHGDTLSIIYFIQLVLWNVLRIFIIIKIALQFQKNDWKVTLIIALAFLSQYFSSSNWVSDFLWILAGSKQVDLKKAIRTFFIAELFSSLIIICQAIMGVIPDIIVKRENNTIRHSLGFTHPNLLAARILQLEAMYLFLKDKSLRVRNILLLFLISVIVFQFTNSTSYLFLSVGIILLIYLLKSTYSRSMFRGISEGLLKKLKYIALAIPLVGTIGMLYLSTKTGKGTLLSRAGQVAIYLRHYGLSWFGQPLEINTGEDNIYLQLSELYTLDDSFMYLLIGFGVICFILFLYGEIRTIYNMIRMKEYSVAIILILYMIYGIAETVTIQFSMNFSLIFLATIFWNDKKQIGEVKKNHKPGICSERIIIN